jgi:hypothetical protein
MALGCLWLRIMSTTKRAALQEVWNRWCAWFLVRSEMMEESAFGCLPQVMTRLLVHYDGIVGERCWKEVVVNEKLNYLSKVAQPNITPLFIYNREAPSLLCEARSKGRRVRQSSDLRGLIATPDPVVALRLRSCLQVRPWLGRPP